jgi:hypothetical protein
MVRKVPNLRARRHCQSGISGATIVSIPENWVTNPLLQMDEERRQLRLSPHAYFGKNCFDLRAHGSHRAGVVPTEAGIPPG